MSRHAPAPRWLIIGLGLLVLSGVLTQVYKDQLLALVTERPAVTHIAPPACDLNHEACLLSILTPVASEGPWTFSITPRPIPVSAPLTFTLTPPGQPLASNRPEAVWVELTGDNMDMGLIRVPLDRMPDGRWEGSGNIPVCITGAMRWRARLYMQLTQNTLQSDWLFTAPLDPRHRPN